MNKYLVVWRIVFEVVRGHVKKHDPLKIEPWGTPPKTGLGLDHASATLTDMVQFERNDANIARTCVLAPLRVNAFRQC